VRRDKDVALSQYDSPLILLGIDSNGIPRRGYGMKTKKTIEIRQIPVNKNGKSIDLSATKDLWDVIPSNWSTKIEENPDRELILLGLFVLGELVGISYYWFDPSTTTGYNYD